MQRGQSPDTKYALQNLIFMLEIMRYREILPAVTDFAQHESFHVVYK